MNEKASNPLALSIAPAMALVRKPYYDFPRMFSLMEQLLQEGLVDGFEFQNLAEWDVTHPPRDEAQRRLAAWQDSVRYTVDEIGNRLQERRLPILSVHANRDVGICLCSKGEADIRRGRQLMHEALSLAEKVGAQVCVFHLWDTWKQSFDPVLLHGVVAEIAPLYPRVKVAVENVPTHLPGHTPFALVHGFPWVTLDLRWAALYDELKEFAAIKERVANVHLRGHLEGDRWVLPNASFAFYEALDLIRNQWGYAGLITMESDGLSRSGLHEFRRALLSLREQR